MGDTRSELEGVVLGVVWKFGPCTPHAIRSHFLGSRSARFSGSAGAIYPLVARLEKAGLLVSRGDRRRLQKRRLYEITPAGARALRAWLEPPFREQDLTALHDPVRARVYFLEAVPRGQRRRFVDQARRGLTRTLAAMERDLAGYRREHARFSALALQGAIEITRAQLRWLAGISRALGKGPARRQRLLRPGPRATRKA